MTLSPADATVGTDTHMDQQHKHLQYNVLQQCGHTHGPAAETLVDLPTTQTCATTM